MLAEYVRLAVVISLILNGAAMITVIGLYFRAWSAARRKTDRVGLLPWHVMAVSSSMLSFMIALAWGLLEQLDRPLNWRLLFYAYGAIANLAAMWIIGRLQTRRINFSREESIVVQQTSTSTTDVRQASTEKGR